MIPQWRLLAVSLAVALGVACYERSEPTADSGARADNTDANQDAVADASREAIHDVYPGDAAEPDAGCTCDSDKPVCLDDGSCVACSADDPSACPTDKPLCDEANACVACLENADCKTEASPVCSAGECVPSSNDGGCSDRGQICDTSTGQCEGCTLAREAERCGDNSCDPKTLACTGTRRESVTICRACVADSECEADHRCIPMYFGTGATRVELGGRCMKQFETGCTAPYRTPLQRTSLSGVQGDEYCGIEETRASCDAISRLLDDTRCSDGLDATCSTPGALCRTVTGAVSSCTYACESSAECPSTFPCPNSGADRYCGK